MGKIRRLTIYSDKIKSSKKILTYSDLHVGFKPLSNVALLFDIPELNPDNFDYIAIAGDIMHSGESLEHRSIEDKVLYSLHKLTGNTATYISLGNHDSYKRQGFEIWSNYGNKKIKRTLRQLPNIHLLDITRKYETDEIEWSGFNNTTDYYLKEREKPEAFFDEYFYHPNKITFSEDNFSILLTHDPKSIYRLSKEAGKSLVPNADLIISGHMHNGFTPIWLQSILKNRGLVSPDYTFFPEIAYGTHQVEDTIFLVNGAVNSFVEVPIINHLLGINCTIIELEPSKEKKLTYTYK